MLTALLLLPLLGAALVAIVPARESGIQKAIGLGTSVLVFLASLPLLGGFRSHVAGYQFTQDISWLADLGIRIQLGIDGLSLFLVLLTTLLVPIALLASWNAIQERAKLFVIAMLFMETATIGAFVTLNLFFFYIFWEMTLIPLYLMIGVFGSGNRIRSANKFFVYTLVGSLLMLVAMVYLGAAHYQQMGYASLYLGDLMRLKLSTVEQSWLFGAFVLSFAIKVPAFPLHTWLPDAHTDAPTAGSVMLAGVMLKLGTYGLMRFAMPLFAWATREYAPIMLWIAVIGIVYGALLAWVQTDIKRLVAYSSVSHLGFVLLGIFSGNEEGTAAAVVQMVNHGISTGALFLCIGMLYERRHTREMSEYGGIATVMPRFALIFMLAVMSSVGLPGLNGFVGEMPILLGAFLHGGHIAQVSGSMEGYLIAGLAVGGVVLGAMYLLVMYRNTMFGPLNQDKNGGLRDLGLREVLVFVPLLILVFWIGLQPNSMYRRIQPTTDKLIERTQKPTPVFQGWRGHRAELEVPQQINFAEQDS